MRFCVALVLAVLFLVPSFQVQAEPIPTARKMLETKDSTIAQRTSAFSIDIHYPITGYSKIDKDIREFAEQLAQSFKATSEEPHTNPYELSTAYVLTSPSPQYLSLVWQIYVYTGGAHSNLEISTFTYSATTGNTIELYDVFEDLDLALEIASDYAERELKRTLEDMADLDMIREGTAPDVENFSRFALTPSGMRFYFPPYQVAPWAAGMQTVEVPLSELSPAKPQRILWGN